MATEFIDNPNDALASAWLRKVKKANKYYSDWSQKFKCDEMEEYFYGFQWKDGSTATKYDRYTINFVFSTVEIKKPSLLFSNIKFGVKAKPANSEFDFESAARRAQTREDVVNTIISDEYNEFAEEFELFVVDAFFRFGIMEVGYSANWVENPNAGKPILKSDNDVDVPPDEENNTLKEPNELPVDERVYIKRIPPWRFRVGGIDGSTFNKCSWVGYYDFYRIEDLRANKNLKNLDVLKESAVSSEDFPTTPTDERTSPEHNEMLKGGDYVKVWTIFDIRARRKMLFLDSAVVTLMETTYDELPLVALKFVEKLRGWYPVPLVFNWKSPQDEINETREQRRLHRRRAKRVYLYEEGTFEDDNEIDKIENGPDMTFAKVTKPPENALFPVPNAPLDQVTNESMVTSADDMNIITATSSEMQGQANRTTATQVNITNQRLQYRDSRSRNQVANSLRKIARLIILTVQKNFTSAFWAKIKTNRFDDDFLGEIKEANDEWKEFTAKDLGGEDDTDFTVDIDIDSISPIENGQQKQSFVDFLTILSQFPQLAFDPTLVREAAYRCGYRNSKVLKNMQKMAQLAMLGQVEQAKAKLGGAPPMGPQQTQQTQMQPPQLPALQSQLAAQGGTQ